MLTKLQQLENKSVMELQQLENKSVMDNRKRRASTPICTDNPGNHKKAHTTTRAASPGPTHK